MSKEVVKLGLWRTMALGIAIVAIWDGTGYLTEGNSVGNSLSLIVLQKVPFGLHLHGAIMLIMACAIIYSSHDRPVLARRVLLCVFAYSVWISAALISGWIISDTVVWGALSKWFLIAWMALYLSATTDHMKLYTGR